MIRLGDHVVVKGEDEEAIVTAVHPDSQIEIEFLEASEGDPGGGATLARRSRRSRAKVGCRGVRRSSWDGH
jgi:hypothetical protein